MTRRIAFVTGGAGFIGSNIVAKLSEDPDLDVVVCDRLRGVDTGKWRNIAKHPIGDIVAPQDMFDWLEKRWRETEIVIHCAGVNSGSETDVDHIIKQNFEASRDLFRWCADRQRRFVWLSSAAVYGAGESGFDDRQDLASLAALRPTGALGWSKALFDHFAARQAARDYAPPQWAGLRLFNVYGPNEWHKEPRTSLPTQIWRRALRGGAAEIFKSHQPDVPDGGQSRDFTYVRDVAEVADWLLRSPSVNGINNLGTGQARSFNELATLVFREAGKAPRIDYVETPESVRSRYRYKVEARIERLREAGYSAPMTSLEDGLADYAGRYLTQADPYR